MLIGARPDRLPGQGRGMKMQTRPVSDALGVEVLDVDLRRPLPEDDAHELRALFDEHGLLLFRAQELSEDDQVRACAMFRPVVEPVGWISNVRAGFHPEVELLWHSDFAFTPHPMLGLSLYAVELAPGAAATRFANNGRAHDRLPAELRDRLASLRLVHAVDSSGGRDDQRVRLDDVGGMSASPAVFPRRARPVLWPHPVTGRPLLFALAQQASQFEGWSCDDSDPVLDEVFAVLYDETNVYEHHWSPGDLVVWDNLLLQHGRRANPDTVARSLRRVVMNSVTTAAIIAGTGFDPEVRARNAAQAVAEATRNERYAR
jgi:alpha-ketoglutarate-dependent taurine dioxygenase